MDKERERGPMESGRHGEEIREQNYLIRSVDKRYYCIGYYTAVRKWTFNGEKG